MDAPAVASKTALAADFESLDSPRPNSASSLGELGEGAGDLITLAGGLQADADTSAEPMRAGE